MSQPEDDELELEALQRRLDDAFATTRPRRGFDDELWLRMQSRRPVRNRFSDLLVALSGIVRSVPAFPAAAVAAVLIVAVGIGLVGYSGLFAGHNSSAASLNGADNLAPQAGQARTQGAFGSLPVPSFAGGTAFVPTGGSAPAVAAPEASAAIAARLKLTITSAPVFRYDEPSTAAADQFAAALGAVLQSRPAGFLGTYETADYTLRIRGTVSSPAAAPAYFILSALTMKSIDVAGGAPDSVAEVFLAEHGLTPPWSYTVSIDSSSSSLIKVRLGRQFVVPGYGLVNLVDASGMPYGIEVDLNGAQPVVASGLLPVDLTSATYPIISADSAVRQALAALEARTTDSASATPPALTSAEFVYVLVPAGDHSFFEPAFLFGVVQSGSATGAQQVLVPAIA